MEVVVGGGVAASCCTQLLRAASVGVTAERTGRIGVPALMVSARTQRLICDAFQREDLFLALPRVEARVVGWGANSEPRRLEHSAIVVSERELLNRLQFGKPPAEGNPLNEAGWTLFASRPLPASAAEHRFGSRVASVFAVDLAEHSEASVCWIESLGCGWLFLLPGPPKKGWLLAVGADYDSLLSESHLVAEQIEYVGEEAGQFPAYPRIAVPFCGPKWLACGTAALAFDPLCGDGTGKAIREAILAAAVIRAAESGAPEEELREHYRNRLLSGFLKHLQLCREFYATGHRGPWWDTELALLQKGIEYCVHELAIAPPARYRLHGFELRPFNAAHTES